MYFQITTDCNMKCPHCCVNGGDNKKYMTFETFKKGLDLFLPYIANKQNYIMIGGGEPTIHPHFWHFLSFSLSKGPVWITTNGKNEEVCTILAQMARRGLLFVILSLDKYHEKLGYNRIKEFMIGSKFYQSKPGFWLSRTPNDYRGILKVIDPVIGGRCKSGLNWCSCPGIMIKPNGDIYACGCSDSPLIGNVDNGITDIRFNKDYDLFYGCHKRKIFDKDYNPIFE